MSEMFLTAEEVAILTGRKFKSKQIEQLRRMALPFWVNALGSPVVPRSAIEGKRERAPLPPRLKVTSPTLPGWEAELANSPRRGHRRE